MNIVELKMINLFDSIPTILKELLNKVEYPWAALDNIGEYIMAKRVELCSSGYEEIMENVFVGKNVMICDTSKIVAPAIIGSNTEIRHCAYLRGNTIIGENCVIGNSTEIKNSIIFDNVQLPHFNYVGDSIIGNHSHLGAGAICSNVKQDKSEIIKSIDRDFKLNLEEAKKDKQEWEKQEKGEFIIEWAEKKDTVVSGKQFEDSEFIIEW